VSPSRTSKIVETILMVVLAAVVALLVVHPDALNPTYTELVGTSPTFAASVTP